MDEKTSNSPDVKWQPLSARDRRVAGVLVEKAKTTPSAYPMTLNAIRTACNQKSNRFPVMELQSDEVSEALEYLRGVGASVEVHSDGRVSKYRHLLYDWLGVEKVEMAVMTELLLRGTQTMGELRGRSARMEPIADLASLRPVLLSLLEKKLIVYLTPEGRGCIVTHTLYTPTELERLRQEYAGPQHQSGSPARASKSDPQEMPKTTGSGGSNVLGSEIQQLRSELAELRADLVQISDQLRSDVDDIRRQLGS
ncbi:MAG: YceH family protein [Planctomycetales bacterium]